MFLGLYISTVCLIPTYNTVEASSRFLTQELGKRFEHAGKHLVQQGCRGDSKAVSFDLIADLRRTEREPVQASANWFQHHGMAGVLRRVRACV